MIAFRFVRQFLNRKKAKKQQADKFWKDFGPRTDEDLLVVSMRVVATQTHRPAGGTLPA